MKNPHRQGDFLQYLSILSLTISFMQIHYVEV